MMIALTAALKAGKVTQDATFSGSLFQKFRPKMKDVSLTERKATKKGYRTHVNSNVLNQNECEE